MSTRRKLKVRTKRMVDSAVDVRDYARHLALGNRVQGDMAWLRQGAPPVVLVHGFLGNRGTMMPLTRRLRADGRAVFSYAHGTFNLGSMRSSAEELLKNVRSICERHDLEQIDMVTFSMGGMIALQALKFLQGHEYVRRLVLLGPPLRGSWMGLPGIATLGAVSPSVWQVLPGSRFLREIREAPLPGDVKVRQIHAREDVFIRLPERMAGVAPEDYIVMRGGHSSLVVHPRFYRAVHEFIDGGLEKLRRDDAALAAAG